MSKSHVLPPNVIGKSSGIFEIEVIDLIWSVNKKTISRQGFISPDWKKINICNCNPNILKFIWWGESQQLGIEYEYNQIKKKLQKVILQYNICTSIKLFYDYLKNCETIEVQIASKISNLKIGTVFAKIPQTFLRVQSLVSCETRNPVVSLKNKILGDLVLNMRMQFFETSSIDFMVLGSNISFDTLQSRRGNINTSSMDVSQSCKTFKPEGKRFKECKRTSSCNSRVMEYLTGHTMSYEDEHEALNEIHRTSPINNTFYNNLLSFFAQTNKQTDTLCKIPFGLNNEQIDSVRLKLKNIYLLPPGIREVFVDSLLDTTFTVECKITPNILDKCKDIRFYSDSYDDKEQRINFYKEAIRCVEFISNEFDPLIIEHLEILFTVFWREFGSKQTRCLGTTKYRFTSLLNFPDLQQTKKLQIHSCAGGTHVADLICKFKLCANGSNFGNLINDLTCNKCADQHSTVPTFSSHSSSKYKTQFSKSNFLCERNYNDNVKSIPNSGNDQNEAKTFRSQLKSNVTSTNTQESTDKHLHINCNDAKDFNELKALKYSNCGSYQLLQGLLYVGSLKNLQAINNGACFLVCQSFWKEEPITTEFAESDNFNFLENPVISMDGWADIVGPLSGNICGQLQTILAVGTEKQLKELKFKHGISSENMYINSPRIPVPVVSHNNILQQINCKAKSSTHVSDISRSTDNAGTSTNQHEKCSDLLGSVIENLQQTLPLNDSSSNVENKLFSEKLVTNNQQAMSLTADLLNVLQKALSTPSISGCTIPSLPQSITNNSSLNAKILLEIEEALHLPRNTTKLVSKKSSNQKCNTNNEKQNLNIRFPPNEEPSAYVTFQAVEGHGPMVKSHEGMVYATNIIEKCSNPSWAKRFEIIIPIDMLVNEEKHFILKVWKKAVTCSSYNRLVPTPMEDSIIGFAAIDLTVLMARMPCISGWFNIVDFNGRINGQLKVNVKPLENVMKFINNKNSSTKFLKYCFGSMSSFDPDICGNDLQTSISSSLPSTAFNLDLNSETNSSTSNDGISDLHNATLSRAIKRKFTELEEITQRLRVRLLDVTGEAELNADYCGFLNELADEAEFDEFERDLNTVCTDEDENLKDCQINYFNAEEINSSKNLNEATEGYNNDNISSRNYITEEGIPSSSSSNARMQLISSCLKRTETNSNENNDV